MIYHPNCILHVNGTSYNDLSRNKFIGTNYGCTQSPNGVFGDCLVMTAPSYISFGNVNSFERTNAFTISFFIKFDTYTPTGWSEIASVVSKLVNLKGFIVHIYGGMYGLELDWKMQSDNTWSYVYNSLTSGAHIRPLGQWNHVCCTTDGNGTTAGMRMYINGSSNIAVSYVNDLNNTIINNGDLRIGNPGWTLSPNTTYFLDEIKMYNISIKEHDSKRLMHGMHPLG